MNSLTAEQTTDMLIKVCEAIIANKAYLTEVDSKIGDGDHGIGMAGGMEKAKQALESRRPFKNVNEVFKTTGMAMLNSMGGASGVIFGSMFLSGVKEMDPKKQLDGKTLFQMMKASLESVKERGKAEVGDKTMVDALQPAVEAMEKECGAELELFLKASKEASHKGMEDTKQYVAKFGRAKSLMERAVGFQDAGATSVAIIFEAMYEYVKEESSKSS